MIFQAGDSTLFDDCGIAGVLIEIHTAIQKPKLRRLRARS